MTSAVEIVRRFRGLRALVIGDAMLDTYFEGTAARLCSEGPVPVVRKTAEHRAPGGAANVAANVSALGAETLYLGVVGADMAGALLREALRERGVDDRWLVEDRESPTIHKLRILADGQYVVRFDEEAGRCCSAETEAALLVKLEEAFEQCDVVMAADYGYGVVSDALLERLRLLREQRHVPLVVDSKQLRRFASFGATVVTPNHLEARLAVEQAAPANMTNVAKVESSVDLSEIERLGRELLKMVDTEQVAITLAGDGVLLMGREGAPVHLPAHPVAQANDVGAGDSFASALTLALGAGASVEEAAQIGIDAAAIAVTKRWTSIVQQQELLQRVSLRDHVSHPNARIPASDAVTREALAHLMAGLASVRQAGRRIVFTNGVFDILHVGHIEFLRQAKTLGDVLVVGVNTDASARRLKGVGRPINSERDRLALVSALDAVDYALLFDDDTPESLIRVVRPHSHVKGGDYAVEDLPEADAVREVGGKVVILPLVGRLSTSGMIDRIITLAAQGALAESEASL